MKWEVSNFKLLNSNFRATHTGFEPVISAVTGRRPLQAGPIGRKQKRRYRDSNSRSACFADTPRTKRISAVIKSSWTDSNCRSTVCKTDAFAARPQDDAFKKSGRPGTRTPKRQAPAVFKTVSSSSRMSSRSGFRHQGSGFRARRGT